MAGENADAVRNSMRLPGDKGGSPLMDFNATPGGQIGDQSAAGVETKGVAGQVGGPPFSAVTLPVEGGIRADAGPAGSVPAAMPGTGPGGAKLGPPVRSAPGGDVFPKGSGTVADPMLPSRKTRALDAVEIKPMSADRLPPVQGPAPTDAPSADGYSGRVTKPTPASGLQPGESSGLLPRQAE